MYASRDMHRAFQVAEPQIGRVVHGHVIFAVAWYMVCASNKDL